MAKGVKPPVEERFQNKERELKAATERYENMKKEQEKRIEILKEELEELRLEKEQAAIYQAVKNSGMTLDEVMSLLAG